MKEFSVGGRTIIVDDEDEWLMYVVKWSVYKSGRTFYAKSSIGHLHHYIAGIPLSGYVTDHIDGNGLNESRSNIRTVTHRQNSQNQHQEKKFKFPGVSMTNAGRYKATITVKGKRKNLGVYKTPEAAFLMYKTVAKVLGSDVLDYSYLNNKDIVEKVRSLIGVNESV